MFGLGTRWGLSAKACFSALIKERPAQTADEMNRRLAGLAEAFFGMGRFAREEVRRLNKDFSPPNFDIRPVGFTLIIILTFFLSNVIVFYLLKINE